MSAEEVAAGDLTRRHCGHHVSIPGLGSDPPTTGLWLARVLHDDADTEVELTVRFHGSGPVRLAVTPETTITVGSKEGQ